MIWLVSSGFPTVSYLAARGKSAAGALERIFHQFDFIGRQILMLEFLFVTLLALVAWPVRLRTLTADERFTRHYLVAIALGPGLVLLCVAAVTGMRLRPAWGMPLWSALGVLMLFSFETRPRGEVWRRTALACVLFGLINIVLAFVEGATGPYITGRGSRTHFPGRALATRAVEAWKQRFDVPLPLVGGERWLAGNVAFYAPSRPSMLSNDGLGNSAPDETIAPWTSIADFQNRGGILVWFTDREGETLPWELRRHFPGAETLPTVTLPWQTGAPLKPVNIGMAVVAPRSNAPPR